jgi:hypothetical protein
LNMFVNRWVVNLEVYIGQIAAATYELVEGNSNGTPGHDRLLDNGCDAETGPIFEQDVLSDLLSPTAR